MASMLFFLYKHDEWQNRIKTLFKQDKQALLIFFFVRWIFLLSYDELFFFFFCRSSKTFDQKNLKDFVVTEIYAGFWFQKVKIIRIIIMLLLVCLQAPMVPWISMHKLPKQIRALLTNKVKQAKQINKNIKNQVMKPK